MRQLTCFLLLYFFISSVQAQEAHISGQVSDSEGGFIVGASVHVLRAVVGAVTDEKGHFELEVPTGTIRLLVTYPGFQDQDTSLTVLLTDRHLIVDIKLQPLTFTRPNLIVLDRRASSTVHASANQRKEQEQLSIVHADQFSAPFISITETLRRIPVVAIESQLGEAKFVQISGLPERLTSFSMDGILLPKVQNENARALSLNFVPPSLIEEVQVHKARIASYNADANSGSVEFHLRQPEEKIELLLQGGLGTNFQHSPLSKVDRGVQQFSAVLNSEISEEKVYGLIGGDYFTNGVTIDERLIERGETGVMGATINRFRPTDTDRRHEKVNLMGAIELRPSIYNKLRLSYNFSRTTDEFVQRQSTFDIARNREVRETSNWQQQSTINFIGLTVENNFKRLRLNYSLSLAESQQSLPERLRFRYLAENIIYDNQPGNPAATFGTATSLGLDQVTFESLKLEETIGNGKINLSYFTNH
ncbi:MAG: carboxypeptidase regulatory-like domain-containing protein, partial [Bacteroidota bacterium]